MEGVWAEGKLRDSANLTPEGIRVFTLIATGNAELAEDRFCEAELERMRRQARA